MQEELKGMTVSICEKLESKLSTGTNVFDDISVRASLIHARALIGSLAQIPKEVYDVQPNIKQLEPVKQLEPLKLLSQPPVISEVLHEKEIVETLTNTETMK